MATVDREKLLNDTEQVAKWFETYGQEKQVEIEALFKNVSDTVFKKILATMEKSTSWSSVKSVSTIDTFYPGGIRKSDDLVTRKFVECISKESMDRLDVHGDGVVWLRFQLKSECKEEPPKGGTTQPVQIRLKNRKQFIYKNSVSYDFTVTQQGRTLDDAKVAKPQFEIEIEWVGQDLKMDAKAAYGRFIYKVIDIMGLCQSLGRRTPSASSKTESASQERKHTPTRDTGPSKRQKTEPIEGSGSGSGEGSKGGSGSQAGREQGNGAEG